MKHVLIKNPQLVGWEYGMLRALEAEIVRQTNAQIIELPFYGKSALLNRAGHGMRLELARKYLPKKKLEIEADVLWYVLMGPENYELDLFDGWVSSVRHRVVYIYDTLAPQFPLIRRLFSNDNFNLKITSFNDALPQLQEITGKEWHCVEQAVPAGLFKPVEASEKLIDFSSYGRRFPVLHEALLEFCSVNGLYYDYTMHAVKNPTAPEEELYRQYAWHLTHSKFTISWPVEFTNPARAGHMHPITCRWFEAAASATIIVGRAPANPAFADVLTTDLVVNLDPLQPKAEILENLEKIYSNFEGLQRRAAESATQNEGRWTWEDRVSRMIKLLH